jgi:hypothetical protein
MGHADNIPTHAARRVPVRAAAPLEASDEQIEAHEKLYRQRLRTQGERELTMYLNQHSRLQAERAAVYEKREHIHRDIGSPPLLFRPARFVGCVRSVVFSLDATAARRRSGSCGPSAVLFRGSGGKRPEPELTEADFSKAAFTAFNRRSPPRRSPILLRKARAFMRLGNITEVRAAPVI